MRKYWLALHALFVAGWVLALWDLYETVLDTGGVVVRAHHGYFGLAFMAIAWGILAVYKRKKG